MVFIPGHQFKTKTTKARTISTMKQGFEHKEDPGKSFVVFVPSWF
jgi:hypothetical protein